MSWIRQIGAGRAGPGRRALALELDPRVRTVTLAWRTLGLGDAEVGSRALYRAVFAEPVDEEEALAWLRGPQADGLLAQVSAGYQGSMTWSGDPVAEWTADAWAAAEALAAGVRTLS